jgi:hypothetical protein
VRRRWRLLIAAGAVLAAGVLVPVAGIELGCRAPVDGYSPDAAYRRLLPIGEGRPEARTWLTYPEWHIVYSAESLGRHLAAGRPPSAYPYGGDIAGFWRSFCAINRVSGTRPGASDAKIMIYTIGVSYTAEMAIKAAYERTMGRLSEWIGGWRSADDRYAAQVQQRYATFMHETPWYRFPFNEALRGEWRTRDRGIRHLERRFATTAEYGAKGIYAKLIGAAGAAAMQPDQVRMRFVARSTPDEIVAIDPRLRVVRSASDGLTVVDTPRYAQFTDLAAKMASAHVQLVEIAGNDDVFVTLLAPDGARWQGTTLMTMRLAERPGWSRYGVAVKVPELLPMVAAAQAHGAALEHVYDY